MQVDIQPLANCLVVLWNKFLAHQVHRYIWLTHPRPLEFDINIAMITRGNNWMIDPQEVGEFLDCLWPDIVVFDPFGVGEIPRPEAKFSAGMYFAKEIDSHPVPKQIIWTALDTKMLPDLPNSFIISQGQTLPQLFQTIAS